MINSHWLNRRNVCPSGLSYEKKQIAVRRNLFVVMTGIEPVLPGLPGAILYCFITFKNASALSTFPAHWLMKPFLAN
jgi:hypothetical protein